MRIAIYTKTFAATHRAEPMYNVARHNNQDRTNYLYNRTRQNGLINFSHSPTNCHITLHTVAITFSGDEDIALFSASSQRILHGCWQDSSGRIFVFAQKSLQNSLMLIPRRTLVLNWAEEMAHIYIFWDSLQHKPSYIFYCSRRYRKCEFCVKIWFRTITSIHRSRPNYSRYVNRRKAHKLCSFCVATTTSKMTTWADTVSNKRGSWRCNCCYSSSGYMSENVVYAYGKPEGNGPISNYNDTSNPIKNILNAHSLKNGTNYGWKSGQISHRLYYLFLFSDRKCVHCDAIAANNVMFSNLFIYSGCLHRWIGISKQKCVFWHQS